MTGGASISISVDNFLGDELYDADSNEPIRDNCDKFESVPCVVSAPAMRYSQRTIRVPV